jgi:heme o synthase
MQLVPGLVQLTKPGITISNTLSAAAGFFLATSTFGFTAQTGIAVIFGVGAIVASACVINNIIDRRIDARMKRTAKRGLVTGNITTIQAASWAALLGVIGFTLLIFSTNWPTLILGVVAYVWYIAVYGIAKRITPWSTLIGAVCGALPPMAGYVAVSGQLDVTAWFLFLLLMIWQMPHFYAISVFRRDDYRAAELPVWSVKYGEESTKRQIFGFIVLFAFIVPFLALTGVVGFSYLIVVLGVAVYWLIQAAIYWQKESAVKWSRRMFGVSLLVLLTVLGAIGLGGYLP